jgi:hypothetical protein
VAFAGPDNKPFLRFSAASPAWQPVNLPDQQSHITELAASPADPDVLYALTSGPWPPTGVPVRLYLSHDGGASWDVIDKPRGAIDGLFAVGGLVQPDASDPQCVFTSINCNGSTYVAVPRAHRTSGKVVIKATPGRISSRLGRTACRASMVIQLAWWAASRRSPACI